jgi:Gas vesicle synthesis protein GvpO
MADDVRERRAEGRERRRSLAAKPFEELSEAADRNGGPSGLDSFKRTAATAAAAALAGALGGAAKAVVDKRRRRDDHADEPDAQTEDDTRDEAGDEPEQDDGSPEATMREDDATDEVQDEPDDKRDHAPEADGRPDADADEEPTQGASQSDAGRIVAQAKSHLEELLGEQAESVSGLERSNGRWAVTLEVVELRRIPESTDVMSSYEVVLDDDGGVISINKKHRYRRSQIEEQ